MKVDREQFLKAVKFIKSAILVTDRLEPLGFVHVRIDEGKAILTAADHCVVKRVTLLEPAQMEVGDAKPFEKVEMNGVDITGAILRQKFMIHKPTLEAFETLCSKHKQKFKDSADQTLKLIEIGPTELVSHRDSIQYEQPAISYPLQKVEDFLHVVPEPVEETGVFADVILTAFKEFNDKAALSVTFSGPAGAVYIEQGDGEYQAAFGLVAPAGGGHE